MSNHPDSVTSPAEAPGPARGDSAPKLAPRHRAARRSGGGLVSTVLEYALTVAVALIVAVLIKTFLLQPFFIPSASMRPTLVENDKIVVSKLHPGVFDIQRGDVIVFQDPDNWLGADPNAPLSKRQQLAKVLSYIGLAPDPSENHLVKRLIGKPGDHIVCREAGGAMSVNGVELNETYVNAENPPCQTSFDVRVPAGKMWVMGDNRYHSADSSWHHAQGKSGFVDQSLVTGKAVFIFMPFDHWGTLNDGEKVFAEVPDSEASASEPPRADTLPAFVAAA